VSVSAVAGGRSLAAKPRVYAVDLPAAPPEGFRLTGKVYDIVLDAPPPGPMAVKLPLPAGVNPRRAVIGHYHDGAWLYSGVLASGDKLVTLATSLSSFAVFQVQDSVITLGPSPTPFSLPPKKPMSGISGPWKWDVLKDPKEYIAADVDRAKGNEGGWLADISVTNFKRVPILVKPYPDGPISIGGFEGWGTNPTSAFVLMPRGSAHFKEVLYIGNGGTWHLAADTTDPALTPVLAMDLIYLGIMGGHIPDDGWRAGIDIVTEWSSLKVVKGFVELLDAFGEFVKDPSASAATELSNSLLDLMMEEKGDDIVLTAAGKQVLDFVNRVSGQALTVAAFQELAWSLKIAEELMMAYDIATTSTSEGPAVRAVYSNAPTRTPTSTTRPPTLTPTPIARPPTFTPTPVSRLVPPLFLDIGANLPGTAIGSVTWGDYNRDGKLDLLVTGQVASGALITRIYRNDGNGAFTDSGISLPGVYASEAALGDYNNDGYPDIALTGLSSTSGSYNPITRIYRNGGNGTFTDINTALGAYFAGTVAWADYNRDGKLDLAVSGRDGSEKSAIYRNDGNGMFADIGAGLYGVMYGASAWGDYNRDGNPDLLVTGWNYGPYGGVSRLYRNDSGAFREVAVPFAGVFESSVAWGDYDGDGDLDVALAGCTSEYCNSLARATIYRNDGHDTFASINAPLPTLGVGAVAWIDYDQDGKLDFILSGCTTYRSPNCTTASTQIFHNDGLDTFTPVASNFVGLAWSALAVGDFNNDGKPDLALNGKDASGTPVTKIYRNDTALSGSK
jgi:hypothetical protein